MKNLGNTVTLTKVIETNDEHNYYYTVKADTISWRFRTLVDAENFVKQLCATYNYKEEVIDYVY